MQPAAVLRATPPLLFDDLTLIVPTLNEADALPVLLDRLATSYPRATLLVADDDSADATRDIARAFDGPLRVTVIHRKNPDARGLTASVADAIVELRTPYFAVLDADLQHPPEAVLDLYLRARKGADLVVGRRLDFRQLSPLRRLASRSAGILTNAYLRGRGQPTVHDPMSGFFGGRTGLAQALVRDHGHEFEKAGFKVLVDLLKFVPRGTRVEETVYEFRSRVAGESKLGRRHFVSLLRQLGPLGRVAAFATESAFSPSFWKFLAVGASGVAVNQILLATLHGAQGIALTLSSLAAIEGAILWNFWWNDQWSFAGATRTSSSARRLVRFNIHCASGAAVNVVVLQALAAGFGVHYLGANLAGIAAATVINWTFARRWTWRERDGASLPAPRPNAAEVLPSADARVD